MPVTLAEADWARWLDKPEERTTLLRSFPAERMECWPVAKDVGSVKNDQAELIVRLTA
jgi:putative SOS response-associated peptidase YedK